MKIKEMSDTGGDKGNVRYLVEIKEMPDIWYLKCQISGGDKGNARYLVKMEDKG